MTKLKIINLLTALTAFVLLVFAGCTKEVPKEMLNKQQPVDKQNVQMPDDSIHRNLTQKQETQETQSTEDSKKLSEQLTKEADEADARYQKTKLDADKKVCIEKQMEAANYLMFVADLPPKQKYRPALRRYRRVLEIDPGNSEAAQNKKQIEDIYKSMGMEIPE